MTDSSIINITFIIGGKTQEQETLSKKTKYLYLQLHQTFLTEKQEK